MKALKAAACTILIIAGLALALSPEVNSAILDRENRGIIAAVDEEVQAAEDTEEYTGAQDTVRYNIIEATDALWESITAYNQNLYASGQAEFRDAWSVTQTPSTVEGLDGNIFGYITIPAMDVELPLYVGASTANLAKGAAILGATSLPVGGENTNSVIAGHRGYRGVPFFREIEKLGVGDAVCITNPWGTIGYRVESIDIISPTDSDKVKIQEGKDMVTLMTCHPYRSNGKYRYVVYCVRDDSVLTEEAQAPSGTDGGYITASDGTAYESSQQDIDMEKLFRRLCGAALVLFTVSRLLAGRRRKNR
ncbi:MAG: class C sortase [Lachnospiraceae bacterium]|nr:class C sortase [Lachnospiraceae bacterium]